VEDFLKELLFFSWLALLLVLETLEVEEPNDLKELILESSLNAWLGLLSQSGSGLGEVIEGGGVSSSENWYWP